MIGLLEKLFGSARQPEAPPVVRRHRGLRSRMDMKADIRHAEFVVFDTELTGLDFKRDSIISIGAIKMKGGSILPMQTYHSLVKPESELKGESVVVHEITHDDLKGARELGEVLEEFLAFVGDAVLVGHFVFIDVNFVSRAMKRLFGVKLQNPAVDTHSIHEWLYNNDAEFARHNKGMTTRNDLFSIAKRYGLETVKAHDAFYDAYLTAQLFQRFVPFLPPCGVRTVKDLTVVGKI